ncbi:lactate utilization protein [candidate division KSB1 bacterium]|nr:lactate utilization protein [candidate division KSB1 bacterium]
MNTARERTLQRLRSGMDSHTNATAPVISDAAIFANYPEPSALVERFGARLVSLKGEFHGVRNVHEAAACVQELLTGLAASSPQVCLRQRHDLIDLVIAQEPWLHTHTTPVSQNLPNEDFAHYQAGLTTADFLIARTGSIVLNSAAAGGRRLSVLPPLHIVIATASQVVASLEEAFAQLKNRTPASYMAIITGPSRTSDIEKILVLGAHGPKRLAVIIVEQA